MAKPPTLLTGKEARSLFRYQCRPTLHDLLHHDPDLRPTLIPFPRAHYAFKIRVAESLPMESGR